MYTYCYNNPVMYFDPTGRCAGVITASTIGGAFLVIGVTILVVVGIAMLADAADEYIDNNKSKTSPKSESPTKPDVNDDAPSALDPPSAGETDSSDEPNIQDDALPNQGRVSVIPGAPEVDAGKQGKHVPGHNNHRPDKSSWLPGESGVRQTQEAWKNSQPHPTKPNTRIGISNDGRVIEIKVSKSGIHGYPIFP